MFTIEYLDQIFDADTCIDSSVRLATSLSLDYLEIEILNFSIIAPGVATVGLTLNGGEGLLGTQGGRVLLGTTGDSPDYTNFTYGTPLDLKVSGILVRRFYLVSVTRTQRTQVEFYCYSRIGFLSATHYGGLYSNVPIADVLIDIVGAGTEFGVSEAASNLVVNGWLPIGTIRESLHALLFSSGLTLVYRPDGSIIVDEFKVNEYKKILVDNTYAEGDLTNPESSIRIEMKEIIYFQSQPPPDPEVLIDLTGSTSPDDLIVEFNSPHYNLTISGGLVLVNSNVNYALVRGSGILMGVPYHLNTRTIIKQEASSPGVLTTTRRISSGLITSTNSGQVAQRALDFASFARVSQTSFALTNETVGDLVSFVNPFREFDAGFLTHMNLILSGTIKAQASITTNFRPPGLPKVYNHVDIVVDNGSYTIPAGVTDYEVVVIGGGQGGRPGKSGSPGKRGTTSTTGNNSGYVTQTTVQYPGPGGAGGAGGSPGQGGKVLTKVLTETTPFQITIGAGGELNGGYGEPTTFGELSSADGDILPGGYYHPVLGEAIAFSGVAGVAGGSGSGNSASGASLVHQVGSTVNIPGVGSWYPGGGSPTTIIAQDSANTSPTGTRMTIQAVVFSGMGGGAAAGSSGASASGGSADANASQWSKSLYTSGSTSKGGVGKSALIIPEVSSKPGVGGDGGHGGGGGGAHGAVRQRHSNYTASGWSYSYGINLSNGANGGAGNIGSKGSNGAVYIFYYKEET